MRGLSVAARAMLRRGMWLRGRRVDEEWSCALATGMRRSFGGAVVVDGAKANGKTTSVVDAWSCGGQRRSFLGCGDGEEGNVLSKIYEERKVIGYSPEQLYAVVAAVDLYQDFVPWCQRSKILKHNNDGSFNAELEIGFKFLVESYISHVELTKPKLIKTTATESGLFDHLINIWEFNPGPVAGSCDLYFLVDFKFQSPIYRQAASMFFKEVVSRLVGSFTNRCQRIYGPGVQVLESSYGQGS